MSLCARYLFAFASVLAPLSLVRVSSAAPVPVAAPTVKADREKPRPLSLYKALRKTHLYAQPRADSAQRAYLVAGDRVQLLPGSDGEWLLGDYLDAAGKRTRAYLRAEDFAPERWVRQAAQTANFSFSVACELHGEIASATAVAVFERDSGRLSQLLPAAGDGRLRCADFVDAADWDFDGELDFTVFAHDGGAGPNTGSHFFFFDRRTKRFVFNAELSERSQPELDRKGRQVRFAERNGCCDHTSYIYKRVDGRLRLVLSTNERLTNDETPQVEVTTRRWVNGRWHVKRRSRPAEPTP